MGRKIQKIDIAPKEIKNGFKIGNLLITYHAIDRLVQRFKEDYSQRSKQWCAQKIYNNYNAGIFVNKDYPLLQPWFEGKLNKSGLTEIVYVDRTRMVLLITYNRTNNLKVVKTVFKAVCKTCEKSRCEHITEYWKKKNEKLKIKRNL